MKYGLIVHGGAWDIPNDLVEDHLSGMSNALSSGFPMLKKGDSALDVAEQVVGYLEDDSTFDAGKGSFLNSIGEVEMDAIIASDDYRIGSVAAIQNVKNPVKIARKILEKNGPVMLVGKGANMFAEQHGFKSVSPETLLVGRELERYQKLKENPDFVPKDAFRDKARGTVGVVVLDKAGRIAVAVSTGGTPKKSPGRVGDTPLFGAGAYIEPNEIAVAATGYGEDLIKTMISKTVVEKYNYFYDVQIATEEAIKHLNDSISGLGGVIALGKSGFGLDWNTPRMAFGVQTSDFPAFIGIEKSDKNKLITKIDEIQ